MRFFARASLATSLALAGCAHAPPRPGAEAEAWRLVLAGQWDEAISLLAESLAARRR